jgi:hypothetical protein
MSRYGIETGGLASGKWAHSITVARTAGIGGATLPLARFLHLPPGSQIIDPAGEAAAITPHDAQDRFDVGADSPIGVLP